ncbi:uncharacterized protein V1518DRAFT_406692 [Limtongia smithiae]|uniref:uncharacterized protein n=1 Tax=Limtongia smithiae TaxID=1125753 RepID=UPI0034D02041
MIVAANALTDDDFYDEEADYDQAVDDETVSPEDQRQWDAATEQVKTLLRGSGVAESQVRSTLWDYYFDVDKTVKLLRSQLKKEENKKLASSQQQTKAQQLKVPDLSSCEDNLFAVAEQGSTYDHSDITSTAVDPMSRRVKHHVSAFDGIPWGIDPSMNTVFTQCFAQPPRQLRGLLGGSSKLAALAKARAEKRRQDQEASAAAVASDGALVPTQGLQPASLGSALLPLAEPCKGSVPVASPVPVPVAKRLSTLFAERGRESVIRQRSMSPAKQLSPSQPVSSLRPFNAVGGRMSPMSASAPTQASMQHDMLSASTLFSSYNPPGLFASSLESKSPDDDSLQKRKQEAALRACVWKEIVNNRLFYLPVSPQQANDVIKAFAKPSPDDIVKTAQTTKGGTTGNSVKKETGIEEDLGGLSIKDQSPPSISKTKINVAKKYAESQRKPHINFVVVGHVDAGKSTLMGRLLYDVGAIDERTIQKYKRDSSTIGKGSFAFAWVLDQSSEERERGVTMDVATSSFESSKVSFTILDAPGHKDFVPNMIAGASEADFAVLVIDSSPNAFESGFLQSGQTKEHALLVRSLGVQRLIIAVNKMDNVQWSESRYEEIKETMLPFLSTVGFAESQVSFIPCSGLSGDNIAEKSIVEELSWYQGRSLLEELENLTSVKRDIMAPMTFAITDAYKSSSNSVAVAGRVNSGTVQIGETVRIVPSMEIATVKAITTMSAGGQVSQTGTDEWAVAGDNVQLVLSNIDLIQIRAGDVLCSAAAAAVPCAKTFTARVILFQLRIPLIKGSNVIVYRGRTNEAAHITKLISVLDKTSGSLLKNKPRHLTSGQTAVIEIEVNGSSGFPMEKFRANKDLGRIVLRQDGNTVAAGIVEEIIAVTKVQTAK